MSPTLLFVSGLVLLLATLDSGWAWHSTVTPITPLGGGGVRCGSCRRSAASSPPTGGWSDIVSIGTIGWCSTKKSWTDRRRTHFPPSVTVAFASKTEDREEVVDTASVAKGEGGENVGNGELEVGEMYSNPVTALLGRFLPDAGGDDADASSSADDGGLGGFIDDFDKPKAMGLSIEEMVRRLDTGLREREWFVTGNVCPELFADDFFFKDPDVHLRGIQKYAEGVRRLFDQETSRAEIISCELDPERTESANASSSDVVGVVSVRWRLSGRVNIGPVGLNIKPYIVTSDLHVRENDGLVVYQEDTFDIPGWDLLLSSFAPWLPFLAPPAPPVSEITSSKTTTTEG